MRFNNGKEMLHEIVGNLTDLYSPEKETYVFLYNDCDSICLYSIDEDEAVRLATEAGNSDEEYWSAFLGWGGEIIDDPSYEDYREGSETPLEWCEAMYDGEWIDTRDYLEWLKSNKEVEA